MGNRPSSFKQSTVADTPNNITHAVRELQNWLDAGEVDHLFDSVSETLHVPMKAREFAKSLLVHNDALFENPASGADTDGMYWATLQLLKVLVNMATRAHMLQLRIAGMQHRLGTLPQSTMSFELKNQIESAQQTLHTALNDWDFVRYAIKWFSLFRQLIFKAQLLQKGVVSVDTPAMSFAELAAAAMRGRRRSGGVMHAIGLGSDASKQPSGYVGASGIDLSKVSEVGARGVKSIDRAFFEPQNTEGRDEAPAVAPHGVVPQPHTVEPRVQIASAEPTVGIAATGGDAAAPVAASSGVKRAPVLQTASAQAPVAELNTGERETTTASSAGGGGERKLSDIIMLSESLRHDYEYLMHKRISLALFMLDRNRTGLTPQDLPEMSASLFSELDAGRTHTVHEADLSRALENMRVRVAAIENEMQRLSLEKKKALERGGKPSSFFSSASSSSSSTGASERCNGWAPCGGTHQSLPSGNRYGTAADNGPPSADVVAQEKQQYHVHTLDKRMAALHSELHERLRMKTEVETLFNLEFHRSVAAFLMTPLPVLDRPVAFSNIAAFHGFDDAVANEVKSYSRPLAQSIKPVACPAENLGGTHDVFATSVSTTGVATAVPTLHTLAIDERFEGPQSLHRVADLPPVPVTAERAAQQTSAGIGTGFVQPSRGGVGAVQEISAPSQIFKPQPQEQQQFISPQQPVSEIAPSQTQRSIPSQQQQASQQPLREVQSMPSLQTRDTQRSQEPDRPTLSQQAREADQFIPSEREPQRFVPLSQQARMEQYIPAEREAQQQYFPAQMGQQREVSPDRFVRSQQTREPVSSQQARATLPLQMRDTGGPQQAREVEQPLPFQRMREADQLVPSQQAREAEQFLPSQQMRESERLPQQLSETDQFPSRQAGATLPLQMREALPSQQARETDQFLPSQQQMRDTERYIPIKSTEAQPQSVRVQQQQQPTGGNVGQFRASQAEVPPRGVPFDPTLEYRSQPVASQREYPGVPPSTTGGTVPPLESKPNTEFTRVPPPSKAVPIPDSGPDAVPVKVYQEQLILREQPQAQFERATTTSETDITKQGQGASVTGAPQQRVVIPLQRYERVDTDFGPQLRERQREVFQQQQQQQLQELQQQQQQRQQEMFAEQQKQQAIQQQQEEEVRQQRLLEEETQRRQSQKEMQLYQQQQQQQQKELEVSQQQQLREQQLAEQQVREQQVREQQQEQLQEQQRQRLQQKKLQLHVQEQELPETDQRWYGVPSRISAAEKAIDDSTKPPSPPLSPSLSQWVRPSESDSRDYDHSKSFGLTDQTSSTRARDYSAWQQTAAVSRGDETRPQRERDYSAWLPKASGSESERDYSAWQQTTPGSGADDTRLHGERDYSAWQQQTAPVSGSDETRSHQERDYSAWLPRTSVSSTPGTSGGEPVRSHPVDRDYSAWRQTAPVSESGETRLHRGGAQLQTARGSSGEEARSQRERSFRVPIGGASIRAPFHSPHYLGVRKGGGEHTTGAQRGGDDTGHTTAGHGDAQKETVGKVTTAGSSAPAATLQAGDELELRSQKQGTIATLELFDSNQSKESHPQEQEKLPAV